LKKQKKQKKKKRKKKVLPKQLSGATILEREKENYRHKRKKQHN